MSLPGLSDEFSVRRHLWEEIHERGLTGVEDLCEAAANCIHHGGRLLFAGNGGSAADAQHLAAEYVGVGLPALALTVDSSVLTAIGNDEGFAHVFSRQIRSIARRGDFLIVHSTSGLSENVIRAVDVAKDTGILTAALTAEGGRHLADRADISVIVPCRSTQLAQEVHLAIGHIVWEYVKDACNAR